MRKILLNLIMSLTLAFPLLASSGLAWADNSCPALSTSQGQILNGVGESGGNGCNSSGVSSLLSTVVGILSYVAGALAIIMIILAGSKYITSGGDANKVGNAKNTLIYALIGLAVAALAQVMVHYVLNQASGIG
jgi:hypothetical protein